ncbi:MAG: sigma-70 family RNA polymerase sigma factor [Rhizobacter sp.]|nr:sigma-70 family RNA polymerase sigma factor [Bacteriovorax sp.]
MLRYQTYTPDEAYAAFSELYGRYSQRVFNFLNKKLKNQADSEDLLQRVFIKIHESKHQYKEKYKFEQWLFVIARSQVLDHFRAAKRYDARIKNSGMVDTSDLVYAEESDLRSQLDSDQHELLEMKFIDELSYQEISKIVNKSEVSLRKSVSRLVNRLKKGEAV